MDKQSNSAPVEENKEDIDILTEKLHRCQSFIYHRVGDFHGQGNILKILAEHPRITQKELLGMLGIKPGSLSETLSKLENKGYIVRERDTEDKRKVQITVTDEGLKSREAQEQSISKYEIFTCLEPEERAELTRILTKLTDDWRERYGMGDKPEHGKHDGPRDRKRRDESDDRKHRDEPHERKHRDEPESKPEE
jgi:DNA-binding MarR family transcriptional regulator